LAQRLPAEVKASQILLSQRAQGIRGRIGEDTGTLVTAVSTR
jgi:hypothetical protein